MIARKEEVAMKVVNPIGRNADDLVTVNSAACRCEIKGTYSKGSLVGNCYCGIRGQDGQYHYVHQAH